MRAFIPVEDGNTLKAVQGVLRRLLESDLIDALMVPMRTPAGAITPTLVTDPALLDQADPLAPAFPVNSARVLGWMTQREPRGRIGAVMRSCEMRAMIELVKLKQACLDCVTLISVDCAGTLQTPAYQENAAGNAERWQELFAQPDGQPAGLRDACWMCEKPVYEKADVVLELFGSDLSQGFQVVLPDSLAEGWGAGESSASHSADGANSTRARVLEELVALRSGRLKEVFSEIRGRLHDDQEGMAGIFAACIRCHNCMTVCPICYCKTCLFKGPVFDHEPIQFMQWAERKGALRLPSDTMLFHLTRLNHMALSCVGCGMCTSVCPADLPVGRVFRAVGDSVQSVFDYQPGYNPEEMLPLVAFQEDEWQEVGQ